MKIKNLLPTYVVMDLSQISVATSTPLVNDCALQSFKCWIFITFWIWNATCLCFSHPVWQTGHSWRAAKVNSVQLAFFTRCCCCCCTVFCEFLDLFTREINGQSRLGQLSVLPISSNLGSQAEVLEMLDLRPLTDQTWEAVQVAEQAEL